MNSAHVRIRFSDITNDLFVDTGTLVEKTGEAGANSIAQVGGDEQDKSRNGTRRNSLSGKRLLQIATMRAFFEGVGAGGGEF